MLLFDQKGSKNDERKILGGVLEKAADKLFRSLCSCINTVKMN